MSNIVGALSGNFTIEDMFLSPAGLKFLTLYATGGLLTFPWLFGSFPMSLIVALLYTGYKKLKKDPAILQKIKSNLTSLIKEGTIRMEIRSILQGHIEDGEGFQPSIRHKDEWQFSRLL